MKTSFSSTVSVQSGLRETMAQTQNALTKANQEVTTGVHADMGVALGADTARNLDLTRDVMRIDTQISTNSIAETRMDSSELALETMADAGQDVLDVLTALSGSASTLDDAQLALESSLNTFTSVANTSVNGEYLFSGTNTDVKPVADYTDPNSAFNDAVEMELNQFLADNGIPSVDAMTPADMDTYLTGLEAKFNGTAPLTDPPHTGLAGEDFWTTYVSQASDTNMTTRITSSEVVETSTNANSQGFRSYMFGTVVATQFLRPEVPEDLRAVATTHATNAIGKGISGINNQRSEIGLSTERLKNANESLAAQKDILELNLNALQGVDPYEASTRVTSLQAQLETAYTLTSRIQQLSLVNFL
ncbi:flagellar hook-associated family protein [Rhizobium sp. FY34]|uniref:flagellar hook-associated family protein n=1 Tax=Rhizobium sp. FY34 TaxID=2562309 RepID=UPI0010C0F83B|nr:flagellar hook-associated family protein [Rhizobium sp. FY34]